MAQTPCTLEPGEPPCAVPAVSARRRGSSRRFLASRRVCSDVPVAVHTRACSLYILYAVASWYVQRACCVAFTRPCGLHPAPAPTYRQVGAGGVARLQRTPPSAPPGGSVAPTACVSHRPSRRRLAARSVGLYYVVNFCLCWLVRVHPGAASARCAGAALWCVPCACCFVLDDQLNVLNAVCLRPVVRAAFSVSVCVYSGLAAPSWSAYIPCDPSSVRAAG